MSRASTASASAIGGSANEQGGEYRARVAALLATCAMRGEPLSGVGLGDAFGEPVTLQLEGDQPLDDVIVKMRSGSRTLLQCKLELTLARSKALGGAAVQVANAVKAGLDPDDRVVLAAARCSRPLIVLADMLERERHAAHGARSGPEQRAMALLTAILAEHLDPAEIETLLAHLVIWQVDPRRGTGHSVLVSRLARTLVAAADAERAASALSDEMRRLARLRAGHDATGLLAALAAPGVKLADGPGSAQTAMQAAALTDYREHCARLGSTLRLFGAPGELADIPLLDADAGVRVDVGDEQRDRTGSELVTVVRRRGRICLTGSAGAGKSTALRTLIAHWAARPRWPVPISAHCRQLAGDGPITDRLLEATTAHIADADRARRMPACTRRLRRAARRTSGVRRAPPALDRGAPRGLRDRARHPAGR